MNQKEAVRRAVSLVCQEANIEITAGFNAKAALTAEQVKNVVTMVTIGLLNGEVEMTADSRAKYDTEAAMHKYSVGLVSNWLRKDTLLNGGSKYEAKNPGSRTGSNDPQLKALKTLRELHKDNADALSEIDAAIATRTAELQAEKQKSIVIDVEALPESLRKFVQG